jgi:hypothetical protein
MPIEIIKLTNKQPNKQTNKQTNKQHGNFPDVLNNFPDGITFKILSIKHAVQTITRNTKIGQHIIRIWKQNYVTFGTSPNLLGNK